jgi:enoyl-CoA hydratase/3-hydroxyacyl-CoA dehydrogenase
MSKNEKNEQSGLVTLDTKNGIAYITINRPEAMNALNQDVITQLDKQFTDAEKNDATKGIVIQGAGETFVAGADIKFFINNIKNNTIDNIVSFTRKGHELFLRIENSNKVTIALLHGLSLGGGSELALSAQAIVATPSGSMGFPETGIGIFPGLGGMIRFAHHVGPELAKYYVFTGRSVKAEEAYELGIITKLVPPEEVDSAIKEVIETGKPGKYKKRSIPSKYDPFIKMCSGENINKMLAGSESEGVEKELAVKTQKAMSFKAPLAVKFANELIDKQVTMSIPDAVELELGRLPDIFSTEDALAGLTTLGKTKFKGK